MPEEWVLEYNDPQQQQQQQQGGEQQQQQQEQGNCVSCLMDRLQQHFKQDDVRATATLTDAQRTLRKKRITDAITHNNAAASSSSSSSSEAAAPPALNEAQLDMISNMTYLVAQVPLLDACQDTQYTAVSMYVCDMGLAKGSPFNRRASEVCELAGSVQQIYGDAFVARVVDDGRDLFKRLDFTLPELASDAAWLSLARTRRIKQQSSSSSSSPASVKELAEKILKDRQQKKQKQLSSNHHHHGGCGCGCDAEQQHVCGVCGKVATLRCSRCKAVWYCAAACQKAHWPTHKQSCKPQPQ